MVQYNRLEIRRIIMHRILAKSSLPPVREHVDIELSERLVDLDEEIRSLLRKRLLESCGKQGKAFELAIEQNGEGSCFDYIKNMKSMSDEEYIHNSETIATLLANAQDTKGSVPGGYFLLVDAYIVNNNTEYPVYVVMKAEKHEALNVDGDGVKALHNVFLSPAQKLYKTCVFEQISFSQPLTNTDFKAYLFDSQFNDGTQLAEYFYKTFLGLTISGNDKVQTKLFYEKFVVTIDECFKGDVETRNHCRDLLRAEMTNNVANLTPIDAIRSIIPAEKRDYFIEKVGNKYPNSFTKDLELIQAKIDKTSLMLTSAIRLYAPTSLFSDETISISQDPEDPTVKIIKIKTIVDSNETDAQ